MREILFKAKRLDTEKWVYGYYVNQYKSYEIYSLDGKRHHVEPKTICEYIGLTDNKNIQIYENDIIKTRYRWHTIVGIVRYEVGCYWIEVDELERYLLLSCDAKHFEVIGNIFDNRELIGGVLSNERM